MELGCFGGLAGFMLINVRAGKERCPCPSILQTLLQLQPLARCCSNSFQNDRADFVQSIVICFPITFRGTELGNEFRAKP
jgi:hypothetical protein